MPTLPEDKREKELFLNSFLISGAFCLVFVIAHLFQYQFDSMLVQWGVYPRQISGLKGILTSPFIHENWQHLINNLWSLFFLCGFTIYTFRRVAYKALLLIWILNGFGVWIIGRESFHIGASGIVFGLAGFLFISGMLRKNRSLQAISMVVVILHWGLLWGMSPQNDTISWEAHLTGFIAGLLCSVIFLRQGPEDDPEPEWMMEEEKEEDPNPENWYWNQSDDTMINKNPYDPNNKPD